MSETTINPQTELAHRANAGIDVYLFWNQPSGRVTISVFDARTNDHFELEVDGCRALDAFNHPFAYAVSRRAGHSSASTDALAA